MKTQKTQLKQKIAATVVVFFMMLMVFGSRDDVFAIGTNTTLTQNIIVGALSMEVSTANLVFNDLTIGVGANSLANLTQVNMRDYRGSGAGWTVAASMNNLQVSASGVNNISTAAVNIMPGSVYALDAGSNTGVTAGAGGVLNIVQNLVSATANNGMGNYKLTNTMLNILYSGNPAQKAGMYQSTMLITIS